MYQKTMLDISSSMMMTNLSVDKKPKIHPEIAQVMMMMNCIFNEIIFNEYLSFLCCASIYSDLKVEDLLTTISDTTIDLTCFNCFTFTNNEFNAVIGPSTFDESNKLSLKELI